MTSPSPSVNYSGSAPTGINAEFDFDSEMPSEEIEQPNSEEPKPKRAKSTTSDVWKSFTKIGVVDGKERARCNGCQKEYIVGGIRYGTSSLLRHIPKCVALPKYHNIGTMMLDAQGKLRSRQLDHKRLREVMAMAVIEHNLPYSFVEYRRVREMLSICNPDVKEYTRNTAMNDVWNLYLDKKMELKQQLSRLPNRICLTSDCWTAYTVEGYICITAHFVDRNWKLNSKILAFCKMEPPHTGQELAGAVFNCLKEWGIDKKIFSLTLDNATANDSMQTILKQHLSLQNSLLCEGQFFHIRCCAHILNLISQEGLKAASSSIQKIRESIKYVKQSEARKILFAKCVEQVGEIDGNVGLRLDVPTRWNSTYVMLDSALKYQRAFGSLVLHDKHFVSCPSSEEWKRGESIRDFLAPFYVITNLFSGSSYPTSNLYFMQIWTIENLLREKENSDDLIIQDMALKMRVKFDKYWSEYSVILAIAAVLDPRLKFDMIQYCYKKFDPIGWETKLDVVKRKMYVLFSQYENGTSLASTSISTSSSTSSSTHVQAHSSHAPQLNYFGEYTDYSSENVSVIKKSDLDTYLEEGKLDTKSNMHLDVLQYWKEHQARFPCLSKMACDLLSIPITTVASEGSFSIGSRVLTKYRCSLLSENVQALICTRNWLQGYSCEGINALLLLSSSFNCYLIVNTLYEYFFL
nr:zinc finger BED domain-containing protein RICESLEEPER 2-like [Ipomoea batatas]